MTLEQMFEIVDALAPNEKGCKIWTVGSDIYPMVYIRGSGNHSVHRDVLSRKIGRPIGDKLFACHKCDTPRCVADDHLYEGSPMENARDMKERGRTATGDRNAMRLYPEKKLCGDKHWSKLHPELIVRGQKNGRFGKPGTMLGKKNPNLAVGMSQWLLQRWAKYWGA